MSTLSRLHHLVLALGFVMSGCGANSIEPSRCSEGETSAEWVRGAVVVQKTTCLDDVEIVNRRSYAAPLEKSMLFHVTYDRSSRDFVATPQYLVARDGVDLDGAVAFATDNKGRPMPFVESEGQFTYVPDPSVVVEDGCMADALESVGLANRVPMFATLVRIRISAPPSNGNNLQLRGERGFDFAIAADDGIDLELSVPLAGKGMLPTFTYKWSNRPDVGLTAAVVSWSR